MPSLTKCPADCEICLESARLRRVRQDRRQATRDDRRARRAAALRAAGDVIARARHLAHPGSAARSSLKQWRRRIFLWTVQGLVLAAALLFLTVVAHALHLV